MLDSRRLESQTRRAIFDFGLYFVPSVIQLDQSGRRYLSHLQSLSLQGEDLWLAQLWTGRRLGAFE